MRLLRMTTRRRMTATTARPVAGLKQFAKAFAIAALLPVTALVSSGSPPINSVRLSAQPEPVRSQEAAKPKPDRTATLEVVGRAGPWRGSSSRPTGSSSTACSAGRPQPTRPADSSVTTRRPPANSRSTSSSPATARLARRSPGPKRVRSRSPCLIRNTGHTPRSRSALSSA
jgi:hypothetical protein